jgi:hypothetical protein
MTRTLARNLGSADSGMVLVAPSEQSISDSCDNVHVDAERYSALIGDIQRFRGSIYLQDGAVQRHQLTPDGRHQTPEDDKGWHILLLDKRQKITACILYHEHENTVEAEDLRMRHCPLATQPEWAPRFWKAVNSEITLARRERLKFAEIGGWAVGPESRRTSGPLTMVLAVYGISRSHGGALGMTTATFRHSSSVVLQRLGGSPLEVDGTALPPYYDPRYDCMMETLRFDSRSPNPKYLGLIDRLRDNLAEAQIITRPTRTPAATPFHRLQSGEAFVQAKKALVQPTFAA